MSLNRENVIWQSQDKTWNRGFFDFKYVNEDSEDFDREWDVIYNENKFNWVSTGHMTPESARQSWNGANPGSNPTIPYRGNAEECKQYDEMVKCFRDPQYADQQQKKRDRAAAKKAANEVEEGLVTAPHAGQRVRVFVGLRGTGTSIKGILQQNGDWLVIQAGRLKQKVYNTRTHKVWVGTQSGQIRGISRLSF